MVYNGKAYYRMDDLGVPPFMEPPIEKQLDCTQVEIFTCFKRQSQLHLARARSQLQLLQGETFETSRAGAIGSAPGVDPHRSGSRESRSLQAPPSQIWVREKRPNIWFIVSKCVSFSATMRKREVKFINELPPSRVCSEVRLGPRDSVRSNPRVQEDHR